MALANVESLDCYLCRTKYPIPLVDEEGFGLGEKLGVHLALCGPVGEV